MLFNNDNEQEYFGASDRRDDATIIPNKDDRSHSSKERKLDLKLSCNHKILAPIEEMLVSQL
jgi:hypothetical protein